MTTHTPGPWYYRQFSIRDAMVDTVHIGDWGNHKLIMQFGPTAPFSNDECAANARLIATAPELLGACQAVDFDCNDDNKYAGGYIINLEAAKMVRAIIIKATEGS